MKPITKILVFGDIHGDSIVLLNTICHASNHDVDFMVCTGDIGPDVMGDIEMTNKLRKQLYEIQTNAILSAIAKLKKPLLFVPGNHDRKEFFRKERHLKGKLRNVDVLLGSAPFSSNGISFLGIGGSPGMGLWPYEWKSDRVTIPPRALSKWNKAQTRILLTHSPPQKCYLDIHSETTNHIGSIGIRDFLRNIKKKPNILICGHIHEGAGVDIVEGTPCLNAGSLLTFMNDNLQDPLSSAIVSGAVCRYYTVAFYSDMIEISEFHVPVDQAGFPVTKIVYGLDSNRVLMKKFGMTFKVPVTDTDPPCAISEKTISRKVARVIKKHK
ncbi:MAG: metallophosphoesterase [Planctomycetes bacterium]|nr:metallophosphoesterase [Planctomycetota bacterium]